MASTKEIVLSEGFGEIFASLLLVTTERIVLCDSFGEIIEGDSESFLEGRSLSIAPLFERLINWLGSSIGFLVSL